MQVCWTNAGQGNDEYTKFQTAIAAGTGAPDVIMLEADVLPSFSIRNALVDLTEFGADDVRATTARAPGRTSRAATRSTRSRSTAARWA